MARKKRQQRGDRKPRHPIQVVARRTGLAADLIRMWERRYGTVAPTRDAAGRRLYTDADIDRLLLLRRATGAGRRIGDVATLNPPELARLVAEDQAERPLPVVGATASPAVSEPAGTGSHLDDCIEAVKAVSPTSLESALDRAAVALSIPALLDRVLVPLLRGIGESCREGRMRVSQEHAATAVVRTFLAQLIASQRARDRAPAIVVATPAGETHELGALMAAVSAAAEGWRVIYLGTDLPAEEIAHAVLATHARGVALSIVYPGSDPRIAEELRRLHRQLPANVPLFVGGASASGYKVALDAIKAVVPTDLYDFRRRLGELQAGN